jgi:tetratricopeptide (TPR) repeat protein
VQKFDKPVEEATTSSLDALKAFTQGKEASNNGDELKAVPFFERAIELDANFAVAYTNLASAYANVGDEVRSVEYEKKAFALRDRVSEREKFDIASAYDWIVSGDLDKETATEELYQQTYPREADPVNNLAVEYCFNLGQFQKAIETGNEAIRISPYAIGAYAAVGCGYLGLNHVDEAKAFLENAQSHHSDFQPVHFNLYVIHASTGDEAGMQRELQWATTSGNAQRAGLLNYAAAGRAFSQGKMKRARELSTQAVQIAKDDNLNDSAAEFLASQALVYAEVGSFTEARERAAASVALSRGRSSLPLVATALALAGESAQAQNMVEELKRRYPSDTPLTV